MTTQTVETLSAQFNQLLAVVGQLVPANGQAAAGTQQTTQFDENVKKAAAERQTKVDAKATEYVDGIAGAFEDFGLFIQGRMLSNLARTARDGYFFSRRLAEFQQSKVDGLRGQRPTTGLEIDPLTDAEDMLATHYRNMEENEVLLAALKQAWIKLDAVAYRELGEREQESFAKMVPDFDISEGAYTAFDNKKNQDYQRRQQQNRQASVMTAKTLARTENHGFL